MYRLTYTDNTIGVTRKPEQEAGFIVFRLPLVRAAIIITYAPGAMSLKIQAVFIFLFFFSPSRMCILIGLPG